MDSLDLDKQKSAPRKIAPRRTKDTNWRKDPAILDRLAQVEERHLAGQHDQQIADALGVGRTTIIRDRRRIQELWLERTGDAVSQLKLEAFDRLEEVRIAAIQAAQFDLATERAIVYEDAPGSEAVRRDGRGSVNFHGNKAASLNVARAAIMDQAKVLGLVTDQAQISVGPGTFPMTFFEAEEDYERAKAAGKLPDSHRAYFGIDPAVI